MLWNNTNRKILAKHVTQENNSVIVKFRTLRLKRLIKFRNYLPLVNLSLRCWFSEAIVCKCFSKQELLKISQDSQENTCAGPCRPSFTDHLRWLFLDLTADTFFQLNLVFTADNRTGFYSELLWKHELNLRSSHWKSSLEKVFLQILQISRENTCVEVHFLYKSLFLIALLKRKFSCGIYKIFKNT